MELDIPMAPSPVVIELNRRKTESTGLPPVVSLRELLVPESARKEFDRARNEARRRDCPKAIGHFEKGLRAFDQDASAQNELGNCYRKLGQLDRAEDSFKSARALSDSVYVSLNLAEVYTAQGRFKEAETLLTETILKKPNAGDAYYGLALVYFQEGLLDDAQAAALQADSHPHRIADLHLLLGEIYWRKQDPAAVIEQLEFYLKEAPNGPQSDRARQVLNNHQTPACDY